MKMTIFYYFALLAFAFKACGQKTPVAYILPECRKGWDTMTVTGQVNDIRKETRKIILTGSDGGIMTIAANDKVERIDEIAVGDFITFGYLKNVKAEFRQTTEEELANPLTVVSDPAKGIL